MKFNRGDKIIDRVVSKENILSIWKTIEEEYKKCDVKTAKLEVIVVCDDNTKYESETDEHINSGGIIDEKTLDSISIDFHDYSASKKILFSITHGNYWYGNNFSVEGDDNTWVGGVFTVIEDKIKSIKPQNHWFYKYKTLSLIVISITMTITLFYLLNLELEFSGMLLYFFILCAVSIYLVMYVIYSDLALWKSIEFDFGPEHKKIEKKRRKVIWGFITILVLPFVFYFIDNIADNNSQNNSTVRLYVNNTVTVDDFDRVLLDLRNEEQLRSLTKLESDKIISDVSEGTYFYVNHFYFYPFENGSNYLLTFSKGAKVKNDVANNNEDYEVHYLDNNNVYVIGFTSNDSASFVSRLDGSEKKEITIAPQLTEDFKALVKIPLVRIVKSEGRIINDDNDSSLFILDITLK